MAQGFNRLRRIWPIWHIAAMSLLLACAACTSLQPANNTLLLGGMHYQGRFAARYTDRYDKVQYRSGSFDFRQQGDISQLDLLSPFGQTLARILTAPAGATLEMPNQPTRHAPDVQTLMQETLGFPLPLADLQYWLQAVPASNRHASVQTDPSTGHITRIQQDAWTVAYLDYVEGGQPAHALVKKLSLSRTDPPLQIKLVLDR